MLILQLAIQNPDVHIIFPKETPISWHHLKTNGSRTYDLWIWVSHVIYVTLIELDKSQEQSNTHLSISTQKFWILACQKYYLLAHKMFHALKCSKVCQQFLLKPLHVSLNIHLFLHCCSVCFSPSPSQTDTAYVLVCKTLAFVNLNAQGSLGTLGYVYFFLIVILKVWINKLPINPLPFYRAQFASLNVF